MFTFVLLGILGVLGAALSRLVADDIKAWTPRLTRYLVECAVRVLLEQQEHYAEAWSAHLDQIPGDLSKILMSVDLLRAAITERAQQAQRLQDTIVNTLVSVDGFINDLSIVTPLSILVSRVKNQIISLPDNIICDGDFSAARTAVLNFDQHVKLIVLEKNKCVEDLSQVKVNLSNILHDKWDASKVEKLRETHATLVEVGVVVRRATLEMQSFLSNRDLIQKSINSVVALVVLSNTK